MSSEIGVGDALEAAEAAGAPLSELSQLLMRHEPAIGVTVPRYVADQLACAAHGWQVSEPVAGAWLLADGASRLVHASEADLLDRLTDKIPGLDIKDVEAGEDCRTLQVQTPGAEVHVALSQVAKLAGADIQDAAAVAIAWGACRLHDTEDGHDCSASVFADTKAEVRTPTPDHGPVDVQDSAVLCEVPLDPLALALLAPRQVLAVSLPAFVEDWLLCHARRWQAPASAVATWLLAEGAGYLYALETEHDTAWRSGPNRWVMPSGGPTGPQRLIEMPGEWLQTILGLLMSLTGDDQAGIVTLAVGVGARMWLDDHGCACGTDHSPGAGHSPPRRSAGSRWMARLARTVLVSRPTGRPNTEEEHS